MTNSRNVFSARIAQLCEERGLTLTGLSKRAGLGKNAVGDILADTTREPRTGTVEKIARGLGVSPQYLTGESDDDSAPNLHQGQIGAGFYDIFGSNPGNSALNDKRGLPLERWSLDRAVPALGIASGADVFVGPPEDLKTGDLALVVRRGEIHICYIVEPYLISLSSEGAPTHFLNDAESAVMGSLQFAGIPFPGNGVPS